MPTINLSDSDLKVLLGALAYARCERALSGGLSSSSMVEKYFKLERLILDAVIASHSEP